MRGLKRVATAVAIVVVALGGVAGPAPAAAATGSDDRQIHVLVVNDDGIDSPGLAALVEVLSADAAYRVTVVAPALQQSGMGHALSIRGEVALRPHEKIHGVTAWSVGATPASTVAVALTVVLADDPPDLVVSGINRGENVGRAPWYSGTIGAAREACLREIPGLAFSQALDWSDPDPDWTTAARWAKPVVDAAVREGLPSGVLLNVNIPRTPPRGYRWADMGLAPDQVSRYEVVRSEGGIRYLKSVWRPPVADERGADATWIRAGFVTVVPLSVDQTAVASFAALQDFELSPPEPRPAGDR